MSDHTVIDSYNVNELVELEMWIQEARNNRNNNNNSDRRKITPYTAKTYGDYDYELEEESEEEKRDRREYLTTGELPHRGAVFSVYSGLRTSVNER